MGAHSAMNMAAFQNPESVGGRRDLCMMSHLDSRIFEAVKRNKKQTVCCSQHTMTVAWFCSDAGFHQDGLAAMIRRKFPYCVLGAQTFSGVQVFFGGADGWSHPGSACSPVLCRMPSVAWVFHDGYSLDSNLLHAPCPGNMMGER